MQAFAIPSTDLSRAIAARTEGRSGGIKTLAEGRSDIHKVNPFLINVEEGFNVRDFDSDRMKEHVDALAQSIVKVGLKRALKVRMKNGKLTLVDGECRLRAVYRAIEVYSAEIRTIKVELADKGMSDADATLGIAVENGSLELTALEKGAVFKRLENYGWSISDIAESVGLTAVRVTQLIELTSVPEAVKVMIREGDIAATLAWDIAKKADFDETVIMARVGEAKVKAGEAGKTRVTARNVTGSRSSLAEKIAAIIAAADIDEDTTEDQHVVCISMSRAEADSLAKLLKIEIAEPTV